MLIDPRHLKHWIDNFYGYGSWDAKFWFVGYEEGGGDLPEEVAAKINYFAEAHSNPNDPTLCDIRELYKHVPFEDERVKAEKVANLYEHRFDTNASLHGAWKNLIAFVHGYQSKKLPDLLKYQKTSFLSPSSGREALIQFYPLPSPHNHAWYYSWLDMPELPFIKMRDSYEKQLYTIRIGHLMKKIAAHRPELVLMYGMNNINAMKQSIGDFFPGTKFKSAKAIKMKIPQHHIADLGETRLLITTQVPTLRHNRIESGFDWEAFGKTLR